MRCSKPFCSGRQAQALGWPRPRSTSILEREAGPSCEHRLPCVEHGSCGASRGGIRRRTAAHPAGTNGGARTRLERLIEGRVFGWLLFTALLAEVWAAAGSVPSWRVDAARTIHIWEGRKPIGVGEELPPLHLRDLAGRAATVALGPRGGWLIFVSDCSTCSEGFVYSAWTAWRGSPGVRCNVILSPEAAAAHLWTMLR